MVSESVLGDVVVCDVLVVGGGVAGCIAGVRAREAGARVVVVDKVRSLRRSGDAGRGLAFLTAFSESGPDWDTAEAFSDWYCHVADGLVDMEVASAVAVEVLPETVGYLEAMGVSFRNSAGGHDRVTRMWTPGPIVIKFDGEDLKPILTERLVESGAEVVGGVHVTSLLQDDAGRVVGAVGFDIRSCAFKVFLAGAVILAAGNPQRVIAPTLGWGVFDTAARPYHGVTGYVLAAGVGAVASCLEFLGTFLFPKGFATGAMGNLLEAGGRLINGRGESIADLADTGEREFGFEIVGKAAREILAGRGPVYIDCRHLDQAVIDDLNTYVSFDAPLFNEFLQQSGLDLRHHPIEFELFNGVWSATGSPKGVVIDAECGSGVPGLFIAGDMATPAYALAGAFTTGYVAGPAAAVFAATAGPGTPAAGTVEAERRRVFAPLERSSGIRWQEFETELQHVMTKHVGLSRTDFGLNQALAYLAEYRQVADTLAATNGHELLRTQEAIDLVTFDQMMAAAALERTETRFQFLMGHYRADYPESNDAEWKGVATHATHDGTRAHIETRIMNPQWRTDQLASTKDG